MYENFIRYQSGSEQINKLSEVIVTFVLKCISYFIFPLVKSYNSG